MTKTDDKVEWISLSEANRRFGPSAPTLRRLIREKKLTASVLGTKYFVTVETMRDFMESLPSEAILPARD